MNTELRDRSIIVALLLAAWAALIWGKTVLPATVLGDINALITQVQVLLGGIVGYHVGAGTAQIGPFVTGVLSSPAPAAAPGQAGFTRLVLMPVLVAIALGLSLLAGCSTVMRGYEAAAVNEVKQVNDNALSIWKAAACAIPVGAVLRSPDVIDAVNKFCGGGPGQLGAQQPISITVQMPATAASGAK